MAVADVNGDGAPDRITADSAEVILVFLGRGDGTLRQAQPFQVGPSPGALVVADLHADRKPDVVTLHRSANGVSILLHRELFRQAVAPRSTSPWPVGCEACIVHSEYNVHTYGCMDEAVTSAMVIFQDTRRFELTLHEHDGTWVAKLQAFVPDRLYPTVYLVQRWPTREEAIAALVRKWHVLFPDDPALVWHDAVTVAPAIPPRRPRRPEGREE